MSDYVIYIELEPYLLQWAIHQGGGVNPIRLSKNSPESDTIRKHLIKPRNGYKIRKPSPSALGIILPYFRERDPRVYNYLPEQATVDIKNSIRARFRSELWKRMYKCFLDNRRIDIELEKFFSDNHIINDDTNYQTVKQIFYRQRKKFAKNGKKFSTSEPTLSLGDLHKRKRNIKNKQNSI